MGKEDLDKGQKTWAPGEIIFRRGDPGGELHFIRTGEVSVYLDEGRGKVEVARLGKDDVLGVMSIFPGRTRTANAQALTEVTSTVVPQPQVHHLVASLPTWVKALFKDVMARLEGADQKLLEAQGALVRLSLEHLLRQAAAMGQALALVGRMAARWPLADAQAGSSRVPLALLEQQVRAIFAPGDGDRCWACYRQSSWLAVDAAGQVSVANLESCRAVGLLLRELEEEPARWDAYLALQEQDLALLQQALGETPAERRAGPTLTMTREQLVGHPVGNESSLARLEQAHLLRFVEDDGARLVLEPQRLADELPALQLLLALAAGSG